MKGQAIMSQTITPPDTAVAPRGRVDPARRRRRRERGGRALRVAAAVLVSVVLVFPLYWMVVVAFSSRAALLTGALRLLPSSFTLDNFAQVLSSFPVATWFGNSVAIALVVAAITVSVSMLAGYAFAQLRFRGSTALFLVSLATLMIPVQVIMVTLFKLVTTLGLYGSYWAVILPTSASAFGVFLARQFILAIPRDLIEAARIDGAGHFRVFLRIVLPLSRPLLAVLFFIACCRPGTSLPGRSSPSSRISSSPCPSGCSTYKVSSVPITAERWPSRC
jgi:multiple sugar transport system permease protein